MTFNCSAFLVVWEIEQIALGYCKRIGDEIWRDPRAVGLLHRKSEWVIVLNANSAIFQLYHGENKLIFNEMMLVSSLY